MRPVIGITMGDPAGIGAEIAVKALARPAEYEKCIPILIGDLAAVEDANRFCGLNLKTHVIKETSEAKGEFGTMDLIDLALLTPGSWKYKTVDSLCGECAYRYVEKSIQLAMNGSLHGVVTGPLNKESLNLAGHHYSGHTEIFAKLTDTKDYAMLLTSDCLRVIHVTTHVSMREACDRVTKERVGTVIRLADESMRLMGIHQPRIGVAGLNPHCSENGLFGHEEELEISPAIHEAKSQGICVEGPIPPDTVFVKAQAGQYDIVVAMYHDQGHIPLKLAGFKLDLATNRYTSMSGVNCTVGLPIIRSSVDHGTAFGKAGEGRANEQSLLDAMDVCLIMAKNKFHI